MRIKYPASLWISITVALLTALLSVALHGLLFGVAVIDVGLILALPYIVRREARWVHRHD